MAIDQKTIDKLDRIGSKYNCGLCLPPLKESVNPFFCIEYLKDDAIKFRDFLIEIKKQGVNHTFLKVRKKHYIEIKEIEIKEIDHLK